MKRFFLLATVLCASSVAFPAPASASESASGNATVAIVAVDVGCNLTIGGGGVGAATALGTVWGPVASPGGTVPGLGCGSGTADGAFSIGFDPNPESVTVDDHLECYTTGTYTATSSSLTFTGTGTCESALTLQQTGTVTLRATLEVVPVTGTDTRGAGVVNVG